MRYPYYYYMYAYDPTPAFLNVVAFYMLIIGIAFVAIAVMPGIRNNTPSVEGSIPLPPLPSRRALARDKEQRKWIANHEKLRARRRKKFYKKHPELRP